MTTLGPASRRLWLKQLGAMTGAGMVSPLALNLAACGAAAAQSAGDYKALVCVFLLGGNDAYNTVLRTDPVSWTRYVAARSATPGSLVLPVAGMNGGILPLDGMNAALHPALPELQGLFHSGRVAVVSNVGPLIEPLTRDQYLDKARNMPAKLFSHNDQQSTWQTLSPEGASIGWGGRLADMLMGSNGQSMFTAISAAGNAVWLSGKKVRQYQVAQSGAIRMGATTDPSGIERIYNVPQMADALRRVATDNLATHVMESDVAAVAARSIAAEKILANALPAASSTPFSALPAGNQLARQLQVVARCIQAQGALGMRRQVFFVSMFGFDTHDNQAQAHANGLRQLDQAMGYFDSTLQAMGVAQQVTTFTASDFGRTFTSNGDGTDHGWGGHHFVMGGAVQGRQICGTLPTYGLRSNAGTDFDDTPDQIHNGILLPRLSVDQFGTRLGRWFGLSPSQLLDVFPNLAQQGLAAPLEGLFKA